MSTAQLPRTRRRGAVWWASIRAKITLPYVLLATLLTLVGAFIATRLIVDSVQERFIRQLLEAGRLATDRVVEIEQENLETLRLLARTEGVAEAIVQSDRATLERLALPIVINQEGERVHFLDIQGRPLLSLQDYLPTESPLDWPTYPFVTRVLNGESDEQGDKFAGLVLSGEEQSFYVAGPVFLGEDQVGLILVGRSLQGLPADLRQASAAQHVTLYSTTGEPLASTFPADGWADLPLEADMAAQILAEQDMAAFPRTISFRGRTYRQVFGPLEVRGWEDLGILSISLSESTWVQASPITQVQMALLIAIGLLAIVLVGTVIAQRISRPILEIAQASQRVAAGDLEQQVRIRTRDEVGDLAESFNEMVRELKRGQQIRDLFGRAVSPQISQALIAAVEKGQVTLTGERRMVTTLFTDIRGFTTIAEGRPPEEVVAILNRVLGAFIEVIDRHEGVVNKFGGDSLLAIFGAPIPQSDHARRAVHAGLEMARRLHELNQERAQRGLLPVRAGIGINTGEVVAGAVGSTERFEYTVIGDAVNVTARVQALERQYDPYFLFITAETLRELGPEHGLDLHDLGAMPLRGKQEPVQVYAVRTDAMASAGDTPDAGG